MPCCRCGAAVAHPPHRVAIARSRRCLAMVGRCLRSSDSLRVITVSTAFPSLPGRRHRCQRDIGTPSIMPPQFLLSSAHLCLLPSSAPAIRCFAAANVVEIMVKIILL
ncbi:hypothetical protein AAHA92_33825 [Salvia divinorum]|uniref:Uncharacterized protein n=1 Tax=Salvia divinorum TaxID=28513 RepID=A0ABD1FHJ2_SALDI